MISYKTRMFNEFLRYRKIFENEPNQYNAKNSMKSHQVYLEVLNKSNK